MPSHALQVERTLSDILIHLCRLLVNQAVVDHVRNARRQPIGFDVLTRREWIDVHPPEAHALGPRPLRLLKLYRDIGFHPHHVCGFHCAAEMDDGGWMRAAELRELRQNPGRAQTLRYRTADDTAKIEILVEMRAQRMTGALHLLRAPVNALAFLGQREPVEQAIEQAEVENRLQPLDAADDGLRACAQCRCGFAKV